jgi:hypothetical protein
MPPTNELTEETLEEYNEVREFFMANPDPVCIPLFLNSFGHGDGYGVYQMVSSVLESYDQSQVVPHLVKSIQSQYQSVRVWSAEIAALFPSPKLVDPLSLLLGEQDYDARCAAIVALEQIDDPRVTAILALHKAEEKDPEILDLIDDVLRSREEVCGVG